ALSSVMGASSAGARSAALGRTIRPDDDSWPDCRVEMGCSGRACLAGRSPLVAICGRSDQVHMLGRTERLAGIRRLDAERGWLLHIVFRLHEYELAGGGQYSCRAGPQRTTARARARHTPQ